MIRPTSPEKILYLFAFLSDNFASLHIAATTKRSRRPFTRVCRKCNSKALNSSTRKSPYVGNIGTQGGSGRGRGHHLSTAKSEWREWSTPSAPSARFVPLKPRALCHSTVSLPRAYGPKQGVYCVVVAGLAKPGATLVHLVHVHPLSAKNKCWKRKNKTKRTTRTCEKEMKKKT